VIINAAVAAAKSVGADKVTSTEGRDAIIKNVAATNVTGVTGPIAFDSKGDTTNKAITLYKVQGGKWITEALPQ
jgi:branched-chain amino acid transport system substrate-binding protein